MFPFCEYYTFSYLDEIIVISILTKILVIMSFSFNPAAILNAGDTKVFVKTM